MWIVKSTRMRGVVLGLVVLSLALIMAGCGGSSETTTTSAAPTTTTAASSSTTSVTFTGDAATVATNWTVAGKAALLENGSQFSKELEAQAASPLTKAATVRITDVKMVSATAADVTYDLLVGGTAALPGQKGQAVLQDGAWKVSAASFQALLALQSGGGTATTVPAP
jgi:hypothetical protein